VRIDSGQRDPGAPPCASWLTSKFTVREPPQLVHGLMSLLNRLMPLMFFIIVVISLFQFFGQHPLSLHGLVHEVKAVGHALVAGWAYVLVLAAALWLVVILGLWHSRRSRALPGNRRRSWSMDILDRLTNRAALEQRLAEETEPVFLDAEAVSRKLKEKVIGQDGVCDDLAAQIRRRLALRQRGKPVGVFLFAGPAGSGKTYLAKRVAIELERKLLHFDMTQFSRGGAASTQLFGSSKGYVGSDSYGKLTAGLRDAPDAVVLLDEFEKAHGDVHKNFLTAWNDGFITEASDGRQVSTVRSVFVMTTNAAVETLSELALQHAKDPDELRRSATIALLASGFAPEVLNRIDRIFVFKPLQGLDIARVGALEIEAMINNYGLEVAAGGIDPELLFALVRRQQRAGAATSSRDLVRLIEETIADSLIEAKKSGARRISLRGDGDRVVAVPVASELIDAAAPPQDYYQRHNV
jgi:ATP-dependent Clp protease ATP-binding subunit ClpE